MTFLNTQLKSRLELLQRELQESEHQQKSKKSHGHRTGNFTSYQDDVLAQELLIKIQQYEAMNRRVRLFLFFVCAENCARQYFH